MKIGITGAAGGIGSILSDVLFEKGHELVLIDDLSSGDTSNFSYSENVEGLIKNNLSDRFEVSSLLRECEIVFHFAATSSLAECQKNPQSALSNNVLTTQNIIEACLNNGSKLVFASTSAVYEGLEEEFYDEEMTVSPHLIYPQTKFFSEQLIKSYGETNKLQYVIFRFFNVYGPRQNFHRANPPLVNYLVKCLTSGSIPKLYAPRNQARDYVYVGDLIDLMVRTTIQEFNFPNGIFNVCSGREISIAQIIEAISQGYGSSFQVDSGNPDQLWEMHSSLFSGPHPLKLEIVQAETLKHSRGDIAKTKQVFGWEAHTDVLQKISDEYAQMHDICLTMSRK